MAALTALAIGATVVGAGLSFYGQMHAGAQAKATGEYNAKLAEQQAQQTELEARETTRRRRLENKRFLGSQRSQYAASGVLIEGTPLEVMSETAGILELEALDYTRQQTAAAQQLRSQGAASRLYGSAQQQASRIGAYGSLLSGTAQTASTALRINS